MDRHQGKTKVRILTRTYQITGVIAHFKDTRLTDYMIEANSFIAVTDAEVTDMKNNKILSSQFLNIARDKIEIVVPYE